MEMLRFLMYIYSDKTRGSLRVGGDGTWTSVSIFSLGLIGAGVSKWGVMCVPCGYVSAED